MSDEKESPYPFVDYDSWLATDDSIRPVVTASSPKGSFLSGGVRPPTLWFQHSQPNCLSPACISAQNSAVHHLYVDRLPNSADTPSPDAAERVYISADLLSRYAFFRASLPPNVEHPHYGSSLFDDAQVIDVISSGIRRNPQQYLHVSGLPSLATKTHDDVPPSTTLSTSLVVQRVEGECEKQGLISAFLTGFDALSDKGDLIIPLRGLVLSVWLAGFLFRVSQLFFKITILRSGLTPFWDDTCFLVAIGKKPNSKNVKRIITLVKRMQTIPEGKQLGYSVPPACFLDPALVAWIRAINAQLIGDTRQMEQQVPSMEACASILRIKKFIWPKVEKIGVYFGTFDPVHANHIALAQWAHAHCGLRHVVLVPNDMTGSDTKSNASLLSHRVAMLELATRKHSEWLSVCAPTGKTVRWEAKGTMAKEIAEKISREWQASGEPVLLMGADSWEKALAGSSRDKTTRHFIGIAKLTVDVLVFPRSQDPEEPAAKCMRLEEKQVPKPIRDRVEFVSGYSDPIEGLSSSSIRAELLHRKDKSNTIAGIDPTVIEYIHQHQLYLGAQAAEDL